MNEKQEKRCYGCYVRFHRKGMHHSRCEFYKSIKELDGTDYAVCPFIDNLNSDEERIRTGNDIENLGLPKIARKLEANQRLAFQINVATAD